VEQHADVIINIGIMFDYSNTHPTLQLRNCLYQTEPVMLTLFQTIPIPLQEIGPLDPVSSLQQQPQQQPLTATSAAKPATGTISGMLADFSKALGEFMLSMISRHSL
jgi:hypothetical protein